jgi:hypothetical protein
VNELLGGVGPDSVRNTVKHSRRGALPVAPTRASETGPLPAGQRAENRLVGRRSWPVLFRAGRFRVGPPFGTVSILPSCEAPHAGTARCHWRAANQFPRTDGTHTELSTVLWEQWIIVRPCHVKRWCPRPPGIAFGLSRLCPSICQTVACMGNMSIHVVRRQHCQGFSE